MKGVVKLRGRWDGGGCRPIPPIPVPDNEGRRFRPTAIRKDERERERIQL